MKDKQTWQETHAIRTRANAIFIAMLGHSAAYAQLALRSSLLLNGGALFALPAFVVAIRGPNIIPEITNLILMAAGLYIAGILAAAISSFFAYADYQLYALHEFGEAELKAVRVEEPTIQRRLLLCERRDLSISQ